MPGIIGLCCTKRSAQVRIVLVFVDMPWMYSMHWPVTVVPRGILTTRPAVDMGWEGATAQVYLSLEERPIALCDARAEHEGDGFNDKTAFAARWVKQTERLVV